MFPKVSHSLDFFLANFIRRNLFLKGNQRSSIFFSSVQFGVGYVLPCLTAAQSTKPPMASHCFWLQNLITESSLVACPAPTQLCENCFPHRWSSSKPSGDEYEIPDFSLPPWGALGSTVHLSCEQQSALSPLPWCTGAAGRQLGLGVWARRKQHCCAKGQTCHLLAYKCHFPDCHPPASLFTL